MSWPPSWPRGLGACRRRATSPRSTPCHGTAADLGGIGMNITIRGNAGITSDGVAVIPVRGVEGSAARAGADGGEPGRRPGRRGGTARQAAAGAAVDQPDRAVGGAAEGLDDVRDVRARRAEQRDAAGRPDDGAGPAWLAQLGTVRPTVRRAKLLAAGRRGRQGGAPGGARGVDERGAGVPRSAGRAGCCRRA